MWPFQENDNYALTRDGMVIKYPAYSIAPYAQGEPEISIPYRNCAASSSPSCCRRPDRVGRHAPAEPRAAPDGPTQARRPK